MPKANTYRAERMLGPYGFSVTDVLVTEGNRKRPATFTKIGDSIDLDKVDIKSMIRSVVSGQINKLLAGGALSTMQQEVSEEKEKEIQEALSEHGIGTYADHPMAAPVQYVSLEPGVMIAVSSAVEKPKVVEVIQPPAPPMTAQLEPGLMAPTGNAGGQTAEVLDSPLAKEPAGKKSRKKKGAVEAADAPQQAETQEQAGAPKSQYADWKFNLDFQAQKRTIVESPDLDFLKWVAENDESVQFQKLAQTKLSQAGA